MTKKTFEKAKDLLKKHEGILFKPYRDSVGKLTIGMGRNLDDVGISSDEAEMMLEHDIDRAIFDLRKVLPDFDTYRENRQLALIDMMFNLGFGHFIGFIKTIEAIRNGDWEGASREMMDSKWSQQVGNRALEDSSLLKEG